jgi:predicted aminopeptidase
MRARKAQTLAKMKEAYAQLKAQWGGRAPFDAWFGAEINNAHLASIATYYTCVPGFQRELAMVGGDLPAFYTRVRELAKMDRKERDELVCGEASG